MRTRKRKLSSNKGNYEQMQYFNSSTHSKLETNKIYNDKSNSCTHKANLIKMTNSLLIFNKLNLFESMCSVA